MLHEKRLEAVVYRCFTTEVFLEIFQNLQVADLKKLQEHLIMKLLMVGYGCSFVAKLNLKNFFFFEKIFFYKIYIIRRKNVFIKCYIKKIFYWKKLFLQGKIYMKM